MSYITIYFNDKPVYLCDTLTPEIEEVRHHPDAVFVDELSTAAINSLLHEISKEQFHAGIIVHDNFQKLKTAFFKHFRLVQAAGGLVKNGEGAILLIFRRGKWDLPKGKLDKGESLADCALREVREETGLSKLKGGKEMAVTYHTYVEYGKHILKESHWYLMHVKVAEKLIPQTEEDITDIRWVTKNELEPYLRNTFPTIASLLQQS